MSVSIVLNSSHNPYSNDRGLLQIRKSEFKGATSIVTYRSNRCLCDKVEKVALAVFVLILTLGCILFIPKARTWIATAFDEFKEKTIFICNEDRAGQTTSIPILPAPTQNPIIAPSAVSATQHQAPQLPPAMVQPAISPKLPQKAPAPRVALSPQQLAHVKFLETVKQEILKAQPGWVAIVEKWQKVSIEDQVWLLELCLFRKQKFLPSLDRVLANAGPSLSRDEIIPEERISDVLNAKSHIQQDFAMLTSLKLQHIFYRVPAFLSSCTLLEWLELKIDSSVSKCDLDFSVVPSLKHLSFVGSNFYRLPIFNQNTSLTWIEFRGGTKIEEVIVPKLESLEQLVTFIFCDSEKYVDFDFSANNNLRSINMACAKVTTLPKLPPQARIILDFSYNSDLSQDSKKKLESLQAQGAIVRM